MLEEKIEEAIRVELKRQAQERKELQVDEGNGLEVKGKIDLAALATAIAGAIAGGP